MDLETKQKDGREMVDSKMNTREIMVKNKEDLDNESGKKKLGLDLCSVLWSWVLGVVVFSVVR